MLGLLEDMSPRAQAANRRFSCILSSTDCSLEEQAGRENAAGGDGGPSSGERGFSFGKIRMKPRPARAGRRPPSSEDRGWS